MQGLRLTLASAAISVVSAVVSVVFVPPALAAGPAEVIAKGLSNPRGIAFAPNGQLFVTEAGRGGDGKCIVLADSRTACYGETGALTRIDPTGKTAPVRVISGLPSMAAAGGFGALGPQGVAFTGAGNGRVVLGLAADASARTGLGAKAYLLGQVLQVGSTGNWKTSADIAAFESANNPVSGGTDSNPYAVAALAQQHVVADAGANALFSVDASGKIATLAKFEARPVPAPAFLGLPAGATIPMQAVPTAVIDGRDGWLYAGQLTGFPFPANAANVYRVSPHGGTPEVYASGFTNIIALAFDASHRLYVLQVGSGLGAPGGPPLAPPGRLIRVNADGTRTVIHQELYFPGGLAIGPDGAAYVTNFGIVPGPVPGAFPDGGQVLRIPLD
jgi:hypothetical protein